MMISVSGKRGIGKTYMLSKKVYERYQQGFFTITNFTHVYANVDCSKENPEVLYEIIRQLGIFKDRGYELCDLDPRFRHSGVFIAIDEAHLYFSADLFKRYQTDERFQDVLKFLAQARKADVEIWYSTQDPAKIDKNWRRYTEEYIRYVPVIPFSYKKMVLQQRETTANGVKLPPYYRREVRYLLPLVWEEHHKLDTENPVFDYSTISTPDGSIQLSPKATLQDRFLVRSGWLDPFPYKLYDSYQMLAMRTSNNEEDFDHLTKYGFVDHTFKRERFPTLKPLLGIKRNDQEVPKRFIRNEVSLPDVSVRELGDTKGIKQPIEFLDDLAFINKIYGSRAERPKGAQASAPHPFWKRQDEISNLAV